MDHPDIFQDPMSLDHRVEPDPLSAARSEGTAREEPSPWAGPAEGLRLADEPQPTSREQERKNRWAELGRIASRVAHEMRDNLTPVTLYLSLLRRRVSQDLGSVDILDKIAPAIATIDATLGDLMNLTSDRDPKLQWVNVRGVIDDVCESLAAQFSAHEVETVTDVPRHLGILVDGNMLRSAIVNLVLNALEAMPDGGRLVVTSYTGRGGLELEVADSGPGLSDEVRRRVFEPFFTTKSGGAGLGLAVVHRVVQQHGGDVVAMNCPEGGAAFTLRFPQRASQAAA